MKSRVIQTQPNRLDVVITGSAHRRRASANRPSTRGRATAVSRLIRRHPMAAFFGLAFVLTWVTVPVGALHGRGAADRRARRDRRHRRPRRAAASSAAG